MSPATIAVVDDHLLLAETLRLALTGPDLRVVTVAPADEPRLLRDLLDVHPDLVLLDLCLGEHRDGTVLIRPLVAAGIRVLVVTGLTDPIQLGIAVEQGAVGVCRKSQGFDALVDATHRALTSSGPIDPPASRALIAALAAERAEGAVWWERLSSLTDREAEVLRALGDGLTVHDMARAWVLSVATVRSHVQAVLHKLDAPSQLQAVLLALQAGWLAPPGPSRSSGVLRR